jgi:hypothetical protein
MKTIPPPTMGILFNTKSPDEATGDGPFLAAGI